MMPMIEKIRVNPSATRIYTSATLAPLIKAWKASVASNITALAEALLRHQVARHRTSDIHHLTVLILCDGDRTQELVIDAIGAFAAYDDLTPCRVEFLAGEMANDLFGIGCAGCFHRLDHDIKGHVVVDNIIAG